VLANVEEVLNRSTRQLHDLFDIAHGLRLQNFI
jgi:hypothetical protein